MFTFKPLEKNDIDLLYQWFKQPHVAQWWPAESVLDYESVKQKYCSKIGSDSQSAFIVYLNDRPIGYIQSYNATKVGGGWWPDEPEGTYGIDQFIGEPDCINKGLGTEMIKAFVSMLFENPKITHIIIDVDQNNLRALRCYEKVGFKHIRIMNTPDGPALIMELTRESIVNRF